MRKQTKEQAAELRANYHALAAQAAQIAENYLIEHPDTVPGVVYGGATGAVYKYLGNKKYRVQPFEAICLWCIMHRLYICKSREEENGMNPRLSDNEIAAIRAEKAKGMSAIEIAKKHNRAVSVIYKYTSGTNADGFVDAGECTEEQRKQLTDEITALTDKPENQACEAAENASDFNAVTVPNYMLTQMSERLAAIESASKADSADFDIVNELEYMLTQLREMLHNRFGEFRIVAASAEGNSAVIKYSTADGLMKLEISRCE